VLPIFAGIVRMHFGWFLAYSLLGMSVWSQSFVLLGYWLGEVMPEIKDYFVYAVAGLLAISIVPPVLKYVLQALKKKKVSV
jgi:membrane-associated protein